ncbi:hypothetical protein B0H21DRAFT_706819 [Amylocystis lapponica]|nr:hypothetical protein B0H21DRAFT_706819 [Amylocystis lapponica]
MSGILEHSAQDPLGRPQCPATSSGKNRRSHRTLHRFGKKVKRKKEREWAELRQVYTDMTWFEENPLGHITAVQQAQRAREVGDGVHGQSGSLIVGMISVPSFCTRHGYTNLSLSPLNMSSFFPLSTPAFALDLADLFTAEYLEEDEGQRQCNEEYWGLFVPDEPSAVPAPSPTPILAEETLLALVALIFPVATPNREETRENEVEPVASGSANPLAILSAVPQVQGKKQARNDDSGEQPIQRQSTLREEAAEATQAAAPSTVLAATKPQRRELMRVTRTQSWYRQDSFAANKKEANVHLRQSHDLKGVTVDSQGRVSCPCKIEADAVCTAKISRGDFGRHLVAQHIAEDMKHMAADAKGRVFCLCKVEGGVVCNAKISCGEYCGHLVERHIPKELMIWKCPREGVPTNGLRGSHPRNGTSAHVMTRRARRQRATEVVDVAVLVNQIFSLPRAMTLLSCCASLRHTLNSET